MCYFGCLFLFSLVRSFVRFMFISFIILLSVVHSAIRTAIHFNSFIVFLYVVMAGHISVTAHLITVVNFPEFISVSFDFLFLVCSYNINRQRINSRTSNTIDHNRLPNKHWPFHVDRRHSRNNSKQSNKDHV